MNIEPFKDQFQDAHKIFFSNRYKELKKALNGLKEGSDDEKVIFATKCAEIIRSIGVRRDNPNEKSLMLREIRATIRAFKTKSTKKEDVKVRKILDKILTSIPKEKESTLQDALLQNNLIKEMTKHLSPLDRYLLSKEQSNDEIVSKLIKSAATPSVEDENLKDEALKEAEAWFLIKMNYSYEKIINIGMNRDINNDINEVLKNEELIFKEGIEAKSFFKKFGKKIDTLYLNNVDIDIKILPPDFAAFFPNLIYITLDKIKSFPKELLYCSKLESIQIVEPIKIPKEINNLDHLKKLVLYDVLNPEDLALRNLIFLHIYLRELPKDFAKKFPNLESLYIVDLKTFSPEFLKLKHLSMLQLPNVDIASVPKKFYNDIRKKSVIFKNGQELPDA